MSQGVILPTQQKMIEAQIILAEMLLSVVMETTERKNKYKVSTLQKSSIEKVRMFPTSIIIPVLKLSIIINVYYIS